MERMESIELDEFESFRKQAYGGKKKVCSTRSLPPDEPVRHVTRKRGSGGADELAAPVPPVSNQRRSSRMEMVLREEVMTMVEEALEDPDSSGSATEDAQLLSTKGDRRHQGMSPSSGRRRSGQARSPVPSHRSRLAQQGRLGRSYSCKPRPRPRNSIGGGKDSANGSARPRAGSAALLYNKSNVSRHSSLTTPGIFGECGEVEIYRVRSFSTTAKGIVKHGDSFKIRSSPARKKEMLQELEEQQQQQQHVQPIPSPIHPPLNLHPADDTIGEEREISGPETGLDGDVEESPEPQLIRVLISGSPGVGKTQLTQQFMTSDFLGNRDALDEGTENRITVVLDDEEAIAEFVDNHACEEAEELPIDIHLVVFSVEDRTSFRFAEARLREIRTIEAETLEPAIVILVANKQDLVRSRIIIEDEGIKLARKFGCKYTEVSAILNHKVDELLVGIVRQVRLRPDRGLLANMAVLQAQRDKKVYGCIPKALSSFCSGFFSKRDDVTKSCENLLAL